MSGRALRPLVAAVGAVVVVAALVVVGRWEGTRHARKENRELAAIRALVPSLVRPGPSAFRAVPGHFSCLLYRAETNKYAIELCYDRQGRLVEAIDRRRYPPKIASLREDPGAATLRDNPKTIVTLLRGLGAI